MSNKDNRSNLATSPPVHLSQRSTPLTQVQRPVAYSLYSDTMALNQEAFHEGLYSPAYHLLLAALDCAKALRDLEAINTIEQTAIEQYHWLEDRLPQHWLVTPIASRTGLNQPYQGLLNFIVQARHWCEIEQYQALNAARTAQQHAYHTQDLSATALNKHSFSREEPEE